jgi:hypothetical protein
MVFMFVIRERGDDDDSQLPTRRDECSTGSDAELAEVCTYHRSTTYFE